MAIVKILPSFIDESATSYDSVDSSHPLSNVIGKDETSETYARWYMTKGTAAETIVRYGFDFSSVPDNATITKITCSAKGRMEDSSIARGGNNNIALKNGDTIVVRSGLTVFNTTASVATIETTDFTRETLDNLRFQFFGSRGLLSTSTQYYMDLFGVSLSIEYTVPEPTCSIYIKVNNEWKNPDVVFKKINGEWIKQTDITSLFSGLSNGDTSPWVYKP